MTPILSKTTLAVAIALAAGACSSKSGPSDSPTSSAKRETSDSPTSKAKPRLPFKLPPRVKTILWPGLDLTTEIPRLAGKWLVQTRSHKAAPSVWEVKGTDVSETDNGVTKGTLSMDSPGRLGFEMDNGTISYLSYARDKDRVWIGTGATGAKVGDTYYLSTMRGLVKFDGKVCNHHRSLMKAGDFDRAVKITCSVEGDTFKYQEPVFLKDGQFEDHQVKIEGDALLSAQMLAGHLLVKAP